MQMLIRCHKMQENTGKQGNNHLLGDSFVKIVQRNHLSSMFTFNRLTFCGSNSLDQMVHLTKCHFRNYYLYQNSGDQ